MKYVFLLGIAKENDCHNFFMRFIFLYVVNKTIIDKYGVGVILIVPMFINFPIYYIMKAIFYSQAQKIYEL